MSGGIVESKKFVEQEQARVRWLKSFEQHDWKRFFSSGFTVHYQVVGRLLRACLYIVAARPGVGKTAYLAPLAYNLDRIGIRIVYATLELPDQRLFNLLSFLHYP